MTPMNEQENLLSGITIAHNLMHRVVSLQQRINQLTTQFAAKTEKKTKRHPVLYAIGGFLIAFTLITSTPLKVITYLPTLPFFSMGGTELQLAVWNIVNLIVSAIIGAILYKVIAKTADKSRSQRNAAIDQSNQRVEANNQALAQSIEQTKQEIFAVQQQWASQVAPWYPMDYDSIEAVDFFLAAGIEKGARPMIEATHQSSPWLKESARFFNGIDLLYAHIPVYSLVRQVVPQRKVIFSEIAADMHDVVGEIFIGML